MSSGMVVKCGMAIICCICKQGTFSRDCCGDAIKIYVSCVDCEAILCAVVVGVERHLILGDLHVFLWYLDVF